MEKQYKMTMREVCARADDVARLFLTLRRGLLHPGISTIHLYGVPRGGIAAALAVSAAIRGHGYATRCVDDTSEADLIVDDIIDSGSTQLRYEELAPHAIFKALVTPNDSLGWVTFPWECSESSDHSGEDIGLRLLQYVGEDTTRSGLKETPARVAKAWRFWTKGYAESPAELLKTFVDGAEGANELVLVRDIPFYSHCEHHLAPIFGTATIGYIPNGRIVGLSKLSRLLDVYARRLQVQERLTAQVADALAQHLQPLGVGVVINARHLCMESRGICKQGHETVTSALRGCLMDAAPREEFMRLAHGARR